MASAPDTTISFELPDGVAAADLGCPAQAEVGDRTVRIQTQAPTRLLAAITAAAVDRGVELTALSVRKPSLEDVFLRLGDDGELGAADDRVAS
jgi:hypothetical protein